MEHITAIIPTCNEEDNIEGALQSVQWADEIMVIDSFSTDRTVEIARKYTSFILEHEYENSAAQKNWAIPQASHPWVFLLDADERVKPALQKEVQDILSNGTDCTGFWVKRENYFMGQRVRFSGWQNDAVIRLFQRDRCKYEEKHVHAEVVTDGKVGRLQGKIEHYTYRGLGRLLEKSDRYTTWGAYDQLPKRKSITLFHLAIKPLARFMKHYFLKLGILDGKVGFIIAALSAYDGFLRELKVWRILQGEDLKKK